MQEAKDLASKGGKNRELLVRRGQVLTERQAQQDLARRIGLRWRAKATGRGELTSCVWQMCSCSGRAGSDVVSQP